MRVVRQAKPYMNQKVAYAVLAAGLTSGVWSDEADASSQDAPKRPQMKQELPLN